MIADEDCVIDQERGAPIPVKMIAKGDASLLRLDLIAAGILTISALLLPGLSGAYVVDLLGVYGSIMSAVLDVSSGICIGNVSSTSCFHIANLVAGIVIGTLLFSQIALWLCARFHNATNAFLSGCMIGSMWAIWPFQNLELEINPFRIADGPHVVSMGNYWPSLQELCSVWYLPILTVISASCVLFLHRLVCSRKTLARSHVSSSRRVSP